jgi:hypothetical protein
MSKTKKECFEWLKETHPDLFALVYGDGTEEEIKVAE